MDKGTLQSRAYDARMAIENAEWRLKGICAAHHLIHGDGGSINTDLLYGLFEILDDAIGVIRQAHDQADAVLLEAQELGGTDDAGL